MDKTIFEIKAPQTDFDLHPLISKRWSPRSFSDKVITEEQVQELLEAARWAASAFNEQPWMYVYALNGTAGFDQLWECLSPGNRPWTKKASVLMVTMARTTSSKNGKPNRWAEHDLGMANAQLLMQASYRDIYCHLMAGFDQEKISTVLNIEEDVRPICMGALGYLGSVDALEEPYRARELNPRSRMTLDKFARAL